MKIMFYPIYLNSINYPQPCEDDSIPFLTEEVMEALSKIEEPEFALEMYIRWAKEHYSNV